MTRSKRPIVQSFWLGQELNAIQTLGIRSFLAHGHDYHLYGFDQPGNVPEGVTWLDAATILPRHSVFTYQHGFGKGSVSAFSNQFRYKLLLERGGWWVDTDVVCLRPFAFDAEYVFASERSVAGDVSAASCVMKSPSGAEMLRYCLEECERADKSLLDWGQIGPRLVQTAITRFALDRFVVAPEVFNPVEYHAFREILAPAFPMSRLSSSAAVHLWNQKWATHYMDPDFPGAPDSLYGQLRARYLDRPDEATSRVDILQKHAAFQDCVIEALRTERDEGLYAHAELLRTRNRLSEAEAQLSTARGEMAAFRMSLSWRLTAPLRSVYDRLNAVARWMSG